MEITQICLVAWEEYNKRVSRGFDALKSAIKKPVRNKIRQDFLFWFEVVKVGLHKFEYIHVKNFVACKVNW